MRSLRVVTALAVLAAVADWIAFRKGWVPLLPGLFAAIVAVVAIGLVVELGFVLLSLARRRMSSFSGASRALLVGGLLAAVVAGWVNWLLSLQGYVILVEGETTRLGQAGQLEALEMGPLGDPGELEVDLALVKVELEATGGGSFNPVSLLETRREGGPIVRVVIGGGRVASIGPLRLRQGAFGYAPRIVVLKRQEITGKEETLLDKVVPFTTRRHGIQGTSFNGEIELESEGLSLSGEVVLDTLDERLQGHPALRLAVRKVDRPLGTGDLLPGHFVDLEDGYRVGFAGMKKWSEIDVARRNYPRPMLVGFGVALLGALAWSLAAWRKW